MMRPAQQNLAGQVLAPLAAQWAADGNRLEGKLALAGGYVPAATLTGDHELFSLLHDECHSEASVGEQRAKV